MTANPGTIAAIHAAVHSLTDPADVPTLVAPITLAEVAELLGLTYNYARQIRTKRPTLLPEPATMIGQSPVWETAVVLAWKAERNRS